MRALGIISMSVALGLLCAPAHAAYLFEYSNDIASDLDWSDPVTTANAQRDCGDIHWETAPGLKKDDTGPPPFGYPYTGYQFQNPGAPQPNPNDVANPANAGATPEAVRATYDEYYDLDGEDQLGLSLDPHVVNQFDPALRDNLAALGLSFEPPVIVYSYDDDEAPGWFKQGLVPTNSLSPYQGIHYGTTTITELIERSGSFGNWTTNAMIRDEQSIILGPNPGIGETEDDDVDALDYNPGPDDDNGDRRYFFWTADHEANLGLDPGSIYLTDRMAAGANYTQVFDDVAHIGVPQDTDLDAFEFCLISAQTYLETFGALPPIPNADVAVVLFSVDDNDVDNDGPAITDVHGDESGGLDPRMIYISDLAGQYRECYLLADDIDALTVPEPTAMCLLALGGVALLRRRR